MGGDSGRLKIPLNKLNYKKKKKRPSCVHDNAKAEKPMECVWSCRGSLIYVLCSWVHDEALTPIHLEVMPAQINSSTDTIFIYELKTGNQGSLRALTGRRNQGWSAAHEEHI